MQALPEYNKRITVPNTMHGNDFQIQVTMFVAFYNAYIQENPFRLSTEDTSVGDFDDIVITYGTGEVVAFQLKHSKSQEPLTLSAFTTGKFSISKHFMSLIGAGKINITIPPYISPNLQLQFVSNQLLPLEIRNHLTPDNQLADSFFNSSAFFTFCAGLSGYTAEIIKLFLKRISFVTTYNNHNLASHIKNSIREKFNTNNDAIYYAFFHEFYQWLQSLNLNRTGNYINHADITNLFQSWYNKYIVLERLCGLTQTKLRMIKTKQKYDFPRTEELTSLLEFTRDATKRTLILSGPGGIGKTTLIQQLFNAATPIDGSYLFLSIHELPPWETIKSIIKIGILKILIIDDLELAQNNTILNGQLHNYLIGQIEQDLDFKLLLISRKGNSNDITQMFTQYIPGRTIETLDVKHLSVACIKEILEKTPQNAESKHRVTAFFTTHNQIKDNKDHSLLTIPFYLNLFLLNPINYLNYLNLDYQLINAFINRMEESKNNDVLAKSSRLAKERKSILRKLVLNKDINRREMALPVPATNSGLISLLEDNILFLDSGKLYFTHRLYEEWTVNHLITRALARFSEEQSKPRKLFKYLEKYLKGYHVVSLTVQISSGISDYVVKQLFNAYKETIDYLIGKPLNDGLLWLLVHFANPIEEKFIQLIKDKNLSEELLTSFLTCSKQLYLFENYNITLKLKNSYKLLELVYEMYLAAVAFNKDLVNQLKAFLVDIQAQLFDIYDFPADITEVLVDTIEMFTIQQRTKKVYVVTSIFSESCLSSLYDCLHNKSRQISWGEDDDDLWSIDDIIDGFDANYDIPNEMIAQLTSNLLDNNQSIDNISIIHLHINDSAIEKICAAIIRNKITHLTDLNLHDNQIGDEGVCAILSLSKHCSIKRLHLGYNQDISDFGVKCIAKIILFSKVTPCHLEYLDLSGITGTNIGCMFIQAVCNYKKGKRQATTIDWEDSNNDSEGEEVEELDASMEQILLMLAIEENEIDFLKEYLQSNNINLNQLFSFYTDNTDYLEKACISPLEYAMDIHGEEHPLVSFLIQHVANAKPIQNTNKVIAAGQPAPAIQESTRCLLLKPPQSTVTKTAASPITKPLK